MATKTSPITPAVLEWSIDQDGRSRSELAATLKVDGAELEAWLAGEIQPRVGEVSKIAKVLHRPRVFFFLPEPPATAAMPSGFRHPPGIGARKVSSSVLVEARRAKRLQRAIASTVADHDRPGVPLATVKEPPAITADAARKWLGVAPGERWADEYEALRRWRGALEAAGILVFDLQLGKDEVRGFADWDERAPMIVVNSTSVSPPARIFTLGHELAHLLLREATACLEPSGGNLTINTRTEQWCERFAAALIMPAGEVRRLMDNLKVGQGQADINAVKATMNAFRVSARAAAVNLSDLGFAQDGLYAAVLAVFRTTAPRKTGTPHSPPRHKLRLRQYGDRVVETILTSLPQSDALSVLRMTVEDVRRLADEVPGVAAL